MSKRRQERAQRWGDAIQRRETRDAARRRFQRVARDSSAKRDGLVVAAYLSARPDGRVVQCHLPGIPPAEMPKRGVCEGMSEDSQRRLLLLLHSIRRDSKLPTMVSLTFPEEFIVTPAEAKKCRRAWAKRVKRKFPAWCSIWRLEAHPEMSARLGRVHPHFHMLTWGAWYDLTWVSRSWASVVWRVLDGRKRAEAAGARLPGMPSIFAKHLAAGTSCERVRKWGGVVYCAKTYLAKAEEYPLGEAGRVWGYDYRQALPLAEEIRVPLTHAEAVGVRLEIEAWMKERRIISDHLVCTFFDDNPRAFVARLLSKVRPNNPPF